MLPSLQKHAPTISILLIVALLIALLFSPPSVRLLSTIIIVFGIGTAILFTIHKNWALRQAQEPPKEGELTNAEFIRNTLIDLFGLALVMGLAILFGRLAGDYAGTSWGVLTGISVAMAVGFGVAFLVEKLWGKVAESVKA